MLTKKEAKENQRQCRRNLGNQLTELRKKQHMSIERFHIETGVSVDFMEKLELGLVDVRLSNLIPLARFFNKKIKVELVD